MSNVPDFKPLSEAIFEPVNKAYKAGGFGLAFLTSGAFLMLIGFLLSDRGPLTYLLVGTGFLLIISTCLLFYLKDIRPLMKIQTHIEENTELLDAIQRSALEMTELASDLQALAFKHASQVSAVIQVIRPQIRALPVVGKLADSDALLTADTLSANIVQTTRKAKQIIHDIEDALTKADPTCLKKYLVELKELRTEIEDLLAGHR